MHILGARRPSRLLLSSLVTVLAATTQGFRCEGADDPTLPATDGVGVFGFELARTRHSGCTGTLLDERTVLTAAHCFATTRDEMRFALSDFAPDRAEIAIEDVMVHARQGGSGRATDFVYDLAIVRLSAPMRGATTLLLATADGEPAPGETVEVRGYGGRAERLPSGEVLSTQAGTRRDLRFPFLENRDDMMTVQFGDLGYCGGYSGAPWVVRGAIVGVVNGSENGPDYDPANEPTCADRLGGAGIATRVALHAQSIEALRDAIAPTSRRPPGRLFRTVGGFARTGSSARETLVVPPGARRIHAISEGAGAVIAIERFDSDRWVTLETRCQASEGERCVAAVMPGESLTLRRAEATDHGFQLVRLYVEEASASSTGDAGVGDAAVGSTDAGWCEPLGSGCGSGEECCGADLDHAIQCIAGRCDDIDTCRVHAEACTPASSGGDGCCGGLTCTTETASSATSCCVAAAGPCRTDGDCCGAMSCSAGRCVARPRGQTCSSTYECGGSDVCLAGVCARP